MKVSIFKRVFTVYKTVGTIFGAWLSPIITGILLFILRVMVTLGQIADHIFFPGAFKTSLKSPIIIVGNPRSGTTFLHRYLVKNGIGTGSQLWQMLYPSIILQKMINILSRISICFRDISKRINPTLNRNNFSRKDSNNPC